MNVDIPSGTLYMLVLKTLARLGPMHGYGIANSIQETTDGVLQVEEGTLYPALQRMLVNGWVTAEWRITENKRRARYYTLTGEGRKQLAAEVRDFKRAMNAVRQVIEPA